MTGLRAELDIEDPVVIAAVRFVLDEVKFADLPDAARFISRLASTLDGMPQRARIVTQSGRWVESVAKPGEGEVEIKDWGSVDVIAESATTGLYRLNLFPGATLPDHVHFTMREAEMVLSPGLMGWAGDLLLQKLHVGDRRRWPHGLPHGYHNPSEEVASLLCIDSPPFSADDEIETGRTPL